ncbi:MAG: Holliday junction resolvase RuvX [Pseudomonadota bacterium]
MRIVAFDFGLRRIGVAVGNQTTGTAQAVDTIAAMDGEPDWRHLHKLLDEWRPGILVVGLPLNMDQTESEMSIRAREFSRALTEASGIESVMVDERLSSAGADHLLNEVAAQTTSTRKHRNKRILARDSLAAELILRTYLNENP